VTELNVQEQAEKVAEYLALASQLKKDSSEADYIRANQLSWELAMWLPAEIYNQIMDAIVNPNDGANILTAVIGVRKLLLGHHAGMLGSCNVGIHAPGAGE